MLSHPHDSITKLTQDDVDQILDTARRIVEDNDLPAIIRHIEGLGRMEQVSWFARSHILYLVHQKWDVEKLGDFFEWASVTFGRAPETVRRMVEIWEWVIEKPGHSQRRIKMLLTKPVSGLWFVKQAAKEGQLGEPEWKQIETAHNKQELRAIMLEVRGEYRRGKDALKIMMEEDGILKARKGNRAYAYVGRLNVEMDDPVVVEAIERIQNAAGIFRR